MECEKEHHLHDVVVECWLFKSFGHEHDCEGQLKDGVQKMARKAISFVSEPLTIFLLLFFLFNSFIKCL